MASQSAVAQIIETDSGMKWYSMEEAQRKAKEEEKKVLIFGYADWCTYCRKMRKEVYSDTTVQKNIYEHYYPVQLNTESEDKIKFNGTEVVEGELAGYLRLTSLPTHYFLDEDGEILGAQPGFLPAEVFEPMLNYVGTGAFSNMKFEDYIKAKNE
ncbi:MAG: thioredoxin fold domain-containing protein [Balneolaceae bacterium]